MAATKKKKPWKERKPREPKSSQEDMCSAYIFFNNNYRQHRSCSVNGMKK
jgi:hypothetical protein